MQKKPYDKKTFDRYCTDYSIPLLVNRINQANCEVIRVHAMPLNFKQEWHEVVILESLFSAFYNSGLEPYSVETSSCIPNKKYWIKSRNSDICAQLIKSNDIKENSLDSMFRNSFSDLLCFEKPKFDMFPLYHMILGKIQKKLKR